MSSICRKQWSSAPQSQTRDAPEWQVVVYLLTLPGQWDQTAVLNFTQKPSQHKTLHLHLIQYIRRDEKVSDASPYAARCQILCQSLSSSCWIATALSLICSQYDATASHSFLRTASPVPAEAEAVCNRQQNSGHQSAAEAQQQWTKQIDNFWKHFTYEQEMTTKRALKVCISKRLRDKVNTVNIMQPFIVRERLKEEEQYSLCCFDWHHCLSHSDRLPG